MSDTLPNIPITPNKWVNLYEQSGIDVGKQVSVYNVGASDLFIAVTETEPSVDSDSYIVLKPRGLPFTNHVGDSGLWAFSGNCKGLVNVGKTVPLTPHDYLLEVRKGNVLGSSTSGIVMRNPNIMNSTYVDLWGGTSNMVLPVANETWEVSSTSANDAFGGTGANAIIQSYLDENLEPKQVVVNLDGSNWVELASDMYRPVSAAVILSGDLNSNEGLITVRKTVTFEPRQYIDIGFSASQDGYYTVPKGKQMIVLGTNSIYEKNQDGNLRSKIMLPNSNTWIIGIDLPVYQNIVPIDINGIPSFAEGTILVFEANSNNESQTTVRSILEILVEDA